MKTIKTDRLTLRIESPEDAVFIKALLDDPESRPYNEPAAGIPIEKIISTLTSHRDAYSTDASTIKSGKGRCAFSVLNSANNEYLGYTSINLCKNLNEVEISYGFKKEVWGKGYGTEAATATLKFAFEETDLPAIYAAVNPKNVASERIINRIGMSFLKKVEWPKQGLVNMYVINRQDHLAHINPFEQLPGLARGTHRC